MPKVIKLYNGFIPTKLDTDEIGPVLTTLNLLVESGIETTDLSKKSSVCSSIIQVVDKLIGGEFSLFLSLNSDNGSPLAGLISAVIGYLKGEVGWTSIASAINVEEVKLGSADHTTTNPEKKFIDMGEGGRSKLDFPSQSMYQLASGIGPINLAKLFLIASGELKYVR